MREVQSPLEEKSIPLSVFNELHIILSYSIETIDSLWKGLFFPFRLVDTDQLFATEMKIKIFSAIYIQRSLTECCLSQSLDFPINFILYWSFCFFNLSILLSPCVLLFAGKLMTLKQREVEMHIYKTLLITFAYSQFLFELDTDQA
jgi:hypothetical protein